MFKLSSSYQTRRLLLSLCRCDYSLGRIRIQFENNFGKKYVFASTFRILSSAWGGELVPEFFQRVFWFSCPAQHHGAVIYGIKYVLYLWYGRIRK